MINRMNKSRTGKRIAEKKRHRGLAGRILAAALSAVLAAGAVPGAGVQAQVSGGVPGAGAQASGSVPGIGAQSPAKKGRRSVGKAAEGGLVLDNGYLSVQLSGENGCFDIRTVEGDKINKDDNNKNLLFPNEGDPTSFTSFQVDRGGRVKEYIFGGVYEGSSPVEVRKAENALIASWSVDDLTFTQHISLVNTGANEHGMAYINYTVENRGEAASVRARVLLDTALGSQDYAYYKVGTALVEQETALGENGYNKSFYCYDDPFRPRITAYLVNASLNDRECRPYRTVFAHWNNLAASLFDYEPDSTMTFTNLHNKKYLTADSACALYYDLGTVAQGASGAAAVNYGVFSNEKVVPGQAAAVNVTAKDVMELTADSTAYVEEGRFTARTAIENVSGKTYEKVRIVLYTTGSLNALDEKGADVGATYEEPYYRDLYDFTPGQRQTLDWNLQAVPGEEGIYASLCFKVYDISADAAMNTEALLVENLMGEGSAWVLCPGTVDKTPQIQFTGSSPELLYPSGLRTFHAAGKNFSMLRDRGSYRLLLSRVDGQSWGAGESAVAIPDENFHIDEGKNILTVTLDDENPGELPEGQYQLTIDYTDPGKEDISAPAMRFAVKKDEKYKNETYGLLVAVKGEDLCYHMERFADEAAYTAALESGTIARENALLEFRGIFSARENGGKTVYTGTSSGAGDNVMTLNSCLDIEDGIVTITEKGGCVTVDFDASITTTGAGTYVHRGVGALTELKAGTDCGLIEYEENGDRAQEPDEIITLLWPSVGQAAQNLLGFLMDFKYGELGVIRHEGAEETRVVGFGAGLDLSFVIPDFQETESNQSLLGDAYNAAIHVGSGMTAEDIRALNETIPYNVDTADTDAGEEDEGGYDISGSIQIDDVLFGGSFLGVNLSVALGIPAYIEGMPSLEGVLTLKTVGDWEVGVGGSCDFSVFCMEGEIYIKSKNNIPVPDKIRFYLGDCTPGLCLDPCGVLWLQGAGGGIEDLYDTIFLTDSIPPLKLILEAQFSLMQVISAKASLALSLRGIGASLTDGKVANLDGLTVLEYAGLQVDWYPEFYFMGSVQVGILDVIKGGGYIVVEQNGFFEFFVKASVSLPGDIPIIGGMQVASAGLGANAEKLWGQVKALGVSLGVVYYWGGSVEWGGGASAEPTYPDLVSAGGRALYEDIPVYYDETLDRTLYACVGTNLTKVQDPEALVLLTQEVPGADALTGNALTTQMSGQKHILTLGQKEKDELLILEWEAQSEEEARKDVEQIRILGKVSGSESSAVKPQVEIRLLDHTRPVEEQGSANGNLTYSPEEAMATLAVSFTDGEAEFDREWEITTGKAANALLYDLEPMPELYDSTTVTVEKNGQGRDSMKIVLHGTGLKKFDAVSFVAVETAQGSSRLGGGLRGALEKETDGSAELLYRVRKEDGTGFADGEEISFELPVQLKSGSYELRVVADDEGSRYHSQIEGEFTYENARQPDMPKITAVEYGGDYRLNVSVEAPERNFGGYRVTVYDEAGEAVQGVSGILFSADGELVQYQEDGSLAQYGQEGSRTSAAGLPAGNPTASAAGASSALLTVGGQYRFRPQEDTQARSQSEEDSQSQAHGRSQADSQSGDSRASQVLLRGLEAGGRYRVGVSAWTQVEEGGRKVLLYSKEQRSDVTVMRERIDTPVSFRGDALAVDVTEKRTSGDGEMVFTTPFYAVNRLKLTLSAAQNVSGTWRLDGGTKEGRSGTIEQKKEAVLSLEDLEEGVHTLEFAGKNEYGDSVRSTYVFGVDTLAPRLMLASPVNGAFFGGGSDSGGLDGSVSGGAQGGSVSGGADDRDTVSGTGAASGDECVIEVQGVTDHGARLTIRNLTTGKVYLNRQAVETDREGRFEKEVKLDAAQAAQTLEITAEDEVGNQARRTVELLNGALGQIQELHIYVGAEDVTNRRIQAAGRHALELRALLEDGRSLVLNDDTLVEWKQNTMEGQAALTQEEGTWYLDAEEGARGIVTAHFLVSDLGSVSASFVFGDGSGEEIDLDSEDTTVTGLEETYEYTGKEIKPDCRVYYKGEELTAGRDYIVQYLNNVEVSDGEETAVLRIVGQGRYKGSRSFTFLIVQGAGPEPGETQSPEPGETQSPKPGETQSPEPGGTQSPEPGETQSPEPGGTQSPEPGETQSPGPGETQSPKPDVSASPKPDVSASPKPDGSASPKPDETQSPKPDGTQSPEPGETESPGPDGTPEPPVMEGDLTYYDGKYYFYEDGEMAVSKEEFVNGGWRWFDADGTMAVDKDVYLFSSGGKWVRYDENGIMIKGQDCRYGGWYCFEPFTGAMIKGPAVLEDGRKVFYDLESGQMLMGEHTIESRSYRFDEADGHLLSGQETNFWVHIDGRAYWYENWTRQGWKPSDLSYRGKEIYDPASDAWYWLDNVQNGAKTVGKDVYLEDSLSAYPDHEDGTGKWVRYDGEGRMVKGWDTNEAGTYYFERITGAMAKGDAAVEGAVYYFDPVTGICRQEKARGTLRKN